MSLSFGKFCKLLCFFLFITACNKKEKLLGENDKMILRYQQLPLLVQDAFMNTSKYVDISKPWNLLNLDSSAYTLEVKTSGPFIDKYMVIDESTDEVYIVPYGKALPFIIYDKYIYIPTKYNIANTEQALYSTYEKYHLNF